MSQPLPDAEHRVEMSQNLRASLQRAGGYAAEQSHRFVTIEHILLALNEDQDALLMLQACAIDQSRLRTDVSEYLGLLQDRIGPDEAAQPVLDTEAGRIVNSAVIAAQKSRRSEVNGAIVLAAIIGDGRTPAANMLRAQGLTFQAAIQALQAAQVPGQQPAAPAKPSPVPQPQPVQQAPPQPQPQAQSQPQEASEPPVAVPPAANQNRVPQINPDAARDRREPRINQPRGGSTDDVLANARQRVEALREGAPRREPPGERSEPPAGQSEQPSQQSEQSEQLPARENASEVGKASEPSKPEPPQPRPLQTADSLTRFERRPPPPAQPGPGENGTQADAEQSAPVPPQELSEQLRKRAEERARAERARKERPAPPPSNFSGEALRRPPPPPRPAPEQQQPRPHPHPQANRPPPQQSAPPAHEPPYQPIGRSEPPIQPPPGLREHAPPGYGQPAQQAPNEYAGGGYQHEQLPVPVPEPRRERPVESVVAGQLVENIPRRMRMAVTEIVEVRIARAELEELARGMRGREAAHQHDLIITKAMSVRLRAPEGGFFIETASPETQWIENKLGILSDDYASWRWTITPQRTGRSLLQLIVSARTIGGDGLAAETALPEQIFEVRVSTNYGRLAGRWAGWISAAVAGGLFARFGEQVFIMGQSLLRSTLGG